MKRPQMTLALFLVLVAWALSAMPAPQARADARDVIAARACGWLDVEDRSLNGADRTEERPDAARVNTLRFRLVPAERSQSDPRTTATPPLAAPPPGPAPRATSEALLSLREPAAAVDDSAAPIVWLVPMPSRWAQRQTVEIAGQLAYRVSWNWGCPATRPARGTGPAIAPRPGIGSLATEAASLWLGDRWPIVIRIRPADSSRAKVDRPAHRDAASTVAAAMSGLAALLQDWSARIEQVAEQQATPSRPRPGASHEDFDWSQTASGLMILGL